MSLRRSPLRRQRAGGLPRKAAPKSAELRRDWSEAEPKRAEGCRSCTYEGREQRSHKVDLAHVMGREHDEPVKPGAKTLRVKAASVLPLCACCHRDYDRGELDILHLLTEQEQTQAFLDAGRSIEAMRTRTMPSDYKPEFAQLRVAVEMARAA